MTVMAGKLHDSPFSDNCSLLSGHNLLKELLIHKAGRCNFVKYTTESFLMRCVKYRVQSKKNPWKSCGILGQEQWDITEEKLEQEKRS